MGSTEWELVVWTSLSEIWVGVIRDKQIWASFSLELLVVGRNDWVWTYFSNKWVGMRSKEVGIEWLYWRIVGS